jgi:hypothetical protein
VTASTAHGVLYPSSFSLRGLRFVLEVQHLRLCFRLNVRNLFLIVRTPFSSPLTLVAPEGAHGKQPQ